MLHKLKTFSDPDLDRQLREIIDAINRPVFIHVSNGKPYQATVDNDGVMTPVIVLTEIEQ